MALAAPPSTSPITPAEQRERLAQLLASRSPAPRRILVIGPDITRCYSGAGGLTSLLFVLAAGRCHIDLMPALGTHEPMTPAELDRMYPGVPHDRVLVHDWRNDLLRIGEIPAGRIEQLSAGRLHFSIAVEINRRLLEGGYDLILSVGQVVPHEVIGMANHSKNLFIGVGGGELLNKSHYLGAVVGMEQIMGRMNNPVRSVMDDAAAHGLAGLPIVYVQTVIAPDPQGRPALHGLFIGEGRRPFEDAARLSQRLNITVVERPLKKCVVYLEPHEFRTTWLGNKSVYRTRMAIADGGELLVLAPGLRAFGEDPGIDRLIRKYGYFGTPATLRQVEGQPELQTSLAAAAHLIHGSSEGRFRIVYAPGKLSREEIESVGYEWADLAQALRRYDPDRLVEGWNERDGEEFYFIRHPGLGLWCQSPIRE
ncbi:MAG TPA: lactate racemase domain-containing protein [Candidatus Sumerlaeota bacterium]|nr:MAG: hypothetical protein BWZ08_00154 [candidate division BRC1 bacterium ADurb.BinA292]HOE97750.1 lactate racemase domain-containing protein [Candidatus Sumerlaeota bacterium]